MPYIEPGSPWVNGYCESFNGKFRNELLNQETFYTLKEVQILTEQWRGVYDTIRPHNSLGYRPPAPETIIPAVAEVTGPDIITGTASEGRSHSYRRNPEDIPRLMDTVQQSV